MAMPPADPHIVRRRIERMEMMLERSMTLPVINRAVGLDAMMGLVPVVGDIMGALLGAYLIWEARNLGMSKWQMTRMAANIGIDTLLGAIPVVGDVFDFAWRSNSRNLRIVRRHLDRHYPGQATVTLDRAGS